jgi:hypothetical protein
MVCGYRAEIRKRKMLVILNAYVDDSGSDERASDSPGVFMLAGYMMPAEAWGKFSDEWAAELVREPGVKCFKMSDAEYGDGYFQGMREEFRKLKVNELAQVIDRFKIKPLSCHFAWEDYRQIVRGRVNPKLDSPYFLLFYQIIKLSHDLQIELNISHPEFGYHKVDFVFDEQGKIGPRAVQWYGGLKQILPEPYRSVLGSTPVFKDDEDVVPLQAADMLAWHLHRHLERPDEHRPVTEIIAQYHIGRILQKEGLADFVENVKRIDPKQLDEAF